MPTWIDHTQPWEWFEIPPFAPFFCRSLGRFGTPKVWESINPPGFQPCHLLKHLLVNCLDPESSNKNSSKIGTPCCLRVSGYLRCKALGSQQKIVRASCLGHWGTRWNYTTKLSLNLHPRKLRCPLGPRDHSKGKFHLPTILFHGICWFSWWFHPFHSLLRTQPDGTVAAFPTVESVEQSPPGTWQSHRAERGIECRAVYGLYDSVCSQSWHQLSSYHQILHSLITAAFQLLVLCKSKHLQGLRLPYNLWFTATTKMRTAAILMLQLTLAGPFWPSLVDWRLPPGFVHRLHSGCLRRSSTCTTRAAHVQFWYFQSFRVAE